MTTFVYRSTDTGAPPGVAGNSGNVTLAAVLRGCLINGYNQKTGVTATQSGGIATFTSTSHGYNAGPPGGVGQVLTITGFTSTDYNIVKGVVLSVTANTWTMNINPLAPATAVGSGTSIVAPADYLGSVWTEPFVAGGGIAVFRQPTSGANGMYLRLDENTSGQYPQVRGYESMSALSTGTNPFPSTSQVAIGSGLYIYKSSLTTSTQRDWMVWTNGKFVVLCLRPSAVECSVIVFGDIKTNKSGDAFHTIIVADTTSAAVTTSSSMALSSNSVLSAAQGSYIARKYDQIGTSARISKGAADMLLFGSGSNMSASSNSLPILNGPDGGLYFCRMHICEADNSGHFRGDMPAIWALCHNIGATYSTGDCVQGTGALAGKVFELVHCSVSNTAYTLAVEVSDGW